MNKKFFIISIIFFLTSTNVFAEQTNYEAQTQRAIEVYKQGDYSHASRLFVDIPEEEKTHDILLLQANCYESLQNYKAAIIILKRILTENRKNYEAYYNLANIYQKNRYYRDSIVNYQLAIKYNPSFSPAYYNCGISYFELKKYKNAISCFKKGLMIDSENPDYYYNLAICYNKIGKKKESEYYKNKYDNFNGKLPLK